MQWLVQTPAGSAPPWFGPSGVRRARRRGRGTAQRSSPSQGDFDGDGVDRPGVLQSSPPRPGTVLRVRRNYIDPGPANSLSTLGTANVQPPGGRPLRPQRPERGGRLHVNAQGQGVWSIASVLTGIRTFTFGQAGDIPSRATSTRSATTSRPSTARAPGSSWCSIPPTGQTETFDASPASSSLAGPRQPRPGRRPVRQPSLLQSGHRQPSAAADLRPHRAGRLRPQDRRLHDPRAQRPVYTVSGFQAGDIPAPADYLGQRLGPGGRLPAQHRPVHPGQPRWAVDHARHPRPVGRYPHHRPAGLPPAQLSPRRRRRSRRRRRRPPRRRRRPPRRRRRPHADADDPHADADDPHADADDRAAGDRVERPAHHQQEAPGDGDPGRLQRRLNAAEAQDLGTYHLTVAGKKGSFTAKNCAIHQAQGGRLQPRERYGGPLLQEAVRPEKESATPGQRRTAIGPAGQLDRPIDGDRNGQPGGNGPHPLPRRREHGRGGVRAHRRRERWRERRDGRRLDGVECVGRRGPIPTAGAQASMRCDPIGPTAAGEISTVGPVWKSGG